ncbi:Gfo/Idh/MocA family protein [Paenibacillus sp. GCM10027626]|uniref:Gfo/Idh/MocA family protein n=1 Tax=Paenibacillus sp. GCM10027626 TaxID=3273411 RepID=UPI00362F49A2
MERLKMAVVGAGVMGQTHARTVAECDSAELVAIVDLNEKLGKEVAQKYGAKYISSVEEAIADESIQAFTVALPDRLHVDASVKILLSGKAVLLEKPMADTLAGAQKIAEAAKKGNARLMVAQIMRFDPRYAQAAESIRKGEIGEIVHVNAKRFSYQEVGIRMRGTSSVMFYLGVHDVDAMQWVTGKKVKSVYARSVSKIMPLHGVNSEDAIFANCLYEDGAIGSLSVSWGIPSYMPSGINAALEIIGTKGVIQIDTSDHGLAIINSEKIVLPDGLHWPEVHGRITGDLKDEVQHFVTSVRDNKPFIISVEEALQTVALNDAILKSAETGEIVEVESI